MLDARANLSYRKVDKTEIHPTEKQSLTCFNLCPLIYVQLKPLPFQGLSARPGMEILLSTVNPSQKVMEAALQ